MAWLNVRVRDRGSPWAFSGPWSHRKLIEIFVELHYRFFGRPDTSTIMAIMRYSRELEKEWPEHTKDYRGP